MPVPLASVAVTVYVPNGVSVVGVPVISPVVVLKLKPAGKAGEIDQLVGVPVTVALKVFIGVPTTKS